MASDRKNFARASKKWHELHEQQAYSAPAGMGKLAIICSYLTDYTSPPERVIEDGRDIDEFKAEAVQLASVAMQLGRSVELALNADGEDMRAVLRDPTISDVVTIGHGALPYLYMPYLIPSDIYNNRFDWKDVSEAADHLKQGKIMQRHCGNNVRRLSVPFGVFAASDQSNVLAAAGTFFLPDSLTCDENRKLQPVTDVTLTYDLVLAQYPRREAPPELFEATV